MSNRSRLSLTLVPEAADVIDTDARTWTLSVPEAGKKYYGLSRNASYAAAKRGDIPVIHLGRKLRVPIAMIEDKLSGRGGSDR